MLHSSIYLRRRIIRKGPQKTLRTVIASFLRAGNDFNASAAFSAANTALSAATDASVAELAAAICALILEFWRRTDEKSKEVGDASCLTPHPCLSRRS